MGIPVVCRVGLGVPLHLACARGLGVRQVATHIAHGRNIFQGGFLGLDNIGVFDRSAPLPTGGFINQADGTSWMAMYSLNLMRIALELAKHNKVYEDIATKFFEHFLHIAEAMNNIGDEGIGLWCDKDEFYYDVLNLPNGQSTPLKIRSMVGLIPLYAVETLEPELLQQRPGFAGRLEWMLTHRPDLAKLVSPWKDRGMGERHLLSLQPRDMSSKKAAAPKPAQATPRSRSQERALAAA